MAEQRDAGSATVKRAVKTSSTEIPRTRMETRRSEHDGGDGVAASPVIIPAKPSEPMEVIEPGDDTATASATTTAGASATNADAEEVVYPQGVKLWLNMASIMLSCFLRGLDLTIVAVAVPSITNHFNTVADIGWYSAANGMAISSTVFFFGKLYTVFDVKRLYLMSIVVFWLGSVACTFAPSSKMFIFGRALVGLGASWQSGGILTYVTVSFPLQKRSVFTGVLMFTQTVAMVASPVLGGALIQRFGWRACFGINIPLQLIALAFTAYGMQSPTHNPDVNLPLSQKLKRLDLTGTLVFVPALTCLLIALQWGGVKYGWADARIIVLLVVSTLLLGTFVYLQHRLQDRATLPPRILKQRSILAGAWFTACCDGVLATTEYYISIYFQGVRGLSPTRSGVLGIPMIVGLATSSLASGFIISTLGYYSPLMLTTTVLSSIASGLLTTLDLDSHLAKAACLLGLLGFAVGLGMQGPMMAVSTILPANDVAIGNAITSFGGGVGSAVFVSVAALLFQRRLTVEIDDSLGAGGAGVVGVNASVIEHAGLSRVRDIVGPDRLRDVLTGYNDATVQTLYIPLALTVASVVGSALTEWRSVKKKTE